MAKRNRQYLDSTYNVELEDGTTFTVELTFRDTLRYEAMVKKSPLAGVAEQGMIPMSAVSKLVWIGGRRIGAIDHRRYEDFEAQLVDVWEHEDEDQDETTDEFEGADDEDGSGVILPDPTESEPTVD